MIDNKTPNLSLPLPHSDNLLEDDVARLREALTTLDAHAAQADTDVAEVLTEALKAATEAAKTALWAGIPDKPAKFPPEGHGHDAISGNADTATRLQTARALSLCGDITGTASFDGSTDVPLSVALSERAQILGNVSGTVAINPDAGLYIAATVTGTVTFTLGKSPAGECATLLLELTNGGSATVRWGMSPRWSNGVAPVLTASGVDLVALTHRGGKWIGALVASNVR